MRALKIVVIGAGSASFGLNTLAHLVSCEKLAGAELALVDVNAGGLALMRKLAERMSREWSASMKISSSTDRRRMLPGADFVIVSIAVDRENRWRLDDEIARRHGIFHYAENGGPGAFSHTARNVPMVLAILRDMEKLCPSAWALNFTNPVPRMALLAHRHTRIRMVGICHQIGFAYVAAGAALARDLGMAGGKGKLPSRRSEIEPYGREATKRAHELIDVKAAGTNHNTWILDLRHRETGKDLYPLFAKRLADMPADWQPLSRKLFELFGVYPATGDGHLSEYLPWVSDAKTGAWERYHLHRHDFEGAKRGRGRMWRRIKRMVSGEEPVDALRETPSERAAEIITGIALDENSYELAVNVPNEGYITNLPNGTIVEVPGVVSGMGVRGVGVGKLARPVAEICRRELEAAELAVEAAVRGDRKLALQAVLFSPGVTDIEVAEKLLDAYLRAHRRFLPQFARRRRAKSLFQ
ncbi:MAG: hypothetical protein V2A58_13250 [Planctomycetota bacterium]